MFCLVSTTAELNNFIYMRDPTPVIVKLSSNVICLTAVLSMVHLLYVYLVNVILFPRFIHLTTRRNE